MRKKKVGVIHHNILSHRGGGDLVSAWMLDSLKDDFDVTFITWGGKIDWGEVDRFYGTSISKKPIPVIHHPVLSMLGIENRPYRLIIALLEKYLKDIAGNFDILLSTYNELDLGPEAIQYIHGPSRSEEGAKKYLLSYNKSFLRGLYYRFCDWYSGFNIENVRKNYTLVNSDWTGTVVKETFGDSIRIETVYPPVFLLNKPKPWEERENAFLIIGDILPEKKTHLAADVIAELRERGHDVTLKIVGDTKNEYAAFVKDHIKKYPFVSHLGRLNRGKVSELIASTKYGIHMRDYEGFGIAIIAVPAFNYFMRLWYPLRRILIDGFRENALIRQIVGKPPITANPDDSHRKLESMRKEFQKGFWPSVSFDPLKGPLFVEYKCRKGLIDPYFLEQGLEIIEAVPIFHPLILRDLFGELCFKTKKRSQNVGGEDLNWIGHVVHSIALLISPNFLNYINLYVVRKKIE